MRAEDQAGTETLTAEGRLAGFGIRSILVQQISARWLAFGVSCTMGTLGAIRTATDLLNSGPLTSPTSTGAHALVGGAGFGVTYLLGKRTRGWRRKRSGG